MNDDTTHEEAPHDEVVNSLMDLQARLRGDPVPAPDRQTATALHERGPETGSPPSLPADPSALATGSMLPSPPGSERLSVVADDLRVTTDQPSADADLERTPSAVAEAAPDAADVGKLSALFRRLDALEVTLSDVDRRVAAGDADRRDVEQRVTRLEQELRSVEDEIVTTGSRVTEVVTADVRAQFEELRRSISERLANLGTGEPQP